MKSAVGFVVLLLSVLASVSADSSCSVYVPENMPTDWVNIEVNCINKIKDQIQTEVTASYTYLEMGAYFSRDTVNRPGFSEFFLSAAKEKRELAIKLIEYLAMRGKLSLSPHTNSITGLIVIPGIKSGTTWTGVSALQAALELETFVNKEINTVIINCERGERNDNHLVDYLTGVYLKEQQQGLRDVAGKLATLKKMQKAQGSLAEFLFDKDL